MTAELLFCVDADDANSADAAFRREADVARGLGLPCSLVDYEALVDDDEPKRAVRRVPKTERPRLGVYRGWMLTTETYGALYAALGARNLVLINTPEQYRHCHHLPESYSLVEQVTPLSRWLPSSATHAEILQALAVFGSRPVVLKDYVKSQKHYWHEACFIPSASDAVAVRSVVERFRELQDPVQGGLVFREYLELEEIGSHPRSGMPLTLEYRCVVLEGRPAAVFPYWDEAEYARGLEPPLQEFAPVFAKIRSRFFTADLARTKAGRWIIVELGDAQVAGLPDRADAQSLYRILGNASLEST